MTYLSDGARLVLLELDAEPRTPISASDLGSLVSMSGSEAGAYLRELRTAGLAQPMVKGNDIEGRVPEGAQALWRPIAQS